MKAATLLLMYVVLPAANAAPVGGDLTPGISLKISGNKSFFIARETKGMTQDAWSKIKQIDEIENKVSSANSITSNADPELEADVRKIVQELAQDSSDSVKAAVDAQSRTSAGAALDPLLLARSGSSIEAARKIIESPPAARFVSTFITSVKAKTFFQYMPAGEYKMKNGSWSSYSSGDMMHIGMYMFRLCEENGKELYKEKILILNDPTKRSINVAANNEWNTD